MALEKKTINNVLIQIRKKGIPLSLVNGLNDSIIRKVSISYSNSIPKIKVLAQTFQESEKSQIKQRGIIHSLFDGIRLKS